MLLSSETVIVKCIVHGCPILTFMYLRHTSMYTSYVYDYYGFEKRKKRNETKCHSLDTARKLQMIELPVVRGFF